jgi:hypothetical protein
VSIVGKERVIERLELLLARVRSRALRAGAEAGGDAGGEEVATLATLATPAEPWVVSAVSAGTLEAEVDRMVASVEGFLPGNLPGNVLENAPGNVRENETEIGRENETDTEIEIEVPSDGHDSRERLVTAEPVSVEVVAVDAVAIELGSIEALEAEPALLEDAAVESAALITSRPPSRPSDESEVHSAAAQESTPPNESADLDQPAAEERPPISSRRVVSSEISQPVERLAHMAFDSEEPPAPRHTPPPESGRLPAAASGTELELEPDDTGVRGATPMLPLRAFQPALRELTPDAVPAEVAPSDAVADVIGEAQRFAPATFVALLDASLAL